MNKDLKKVNLNKKYYGVQKALDHLDEEFIEFLPKKRYYEEFFKLYREGFYGISKKTHRDFLIKSMEYAYPTGFQPSIELQKADIEEQLLVTREQLDSIEREHFYFKNNAFLMDLVDEELSGGHITSGHQIWYMHSGKKREIKDLQTYLNLKNRKFKNQGIETSTIPDKDFIIFLSTATLEGIPSGPDINVLADVNISNLEINIYPMTLEEYRNNDNETDIHDAQTALAPENREI